MAAKGTESKNAIFNKLKEVYSNAFWENEGKILRIPMDENGTRVEIKVQLTAAKTNLGGEDVPSAFTVEKTPSLNNAATASPPAESSKTEMTEEEKVNVQKLIESLGL